MTVRPTRAAIDALITALGSPEPFERERAAARLALAGQAARRRLAAVVIDETAPVAARAAAMQILAGTRGADVVRAALTATESDQDTIAVEGIAALGPIATSTDADAAPALDRLTAIVLDRTLGASRRRTALQALEGLSTPLLEPVRLALARDPSAPTDDCAALADAAEHDLPLTAERFGALLAQERDGVSVTLLCRLIDLVRQKEAAAPDGGAAAWATARGQLHEALARRRSTIALYDLREAFDRATGPLPVGFLAAASTIADASCLDGIASAWVRASTAGADPWYGDRLVEVFRAVARREGLTRRSPGIGRIVARHPTAIALAAEVPARADRAR